MEPKFVIQGVDYPVAAWDTFDMGEAEILSSKTGLTLIDLSSGDIQLTAELVSTMLIVSYMRGNPNATRASAEKIVAKVKLLDAIEHMGGTEEGDADVPPSQEPKQNDDSQSSGSSPNTSGGDSNESSESPPDITHLPIGQRQSDTLQTSVREQFGA
jgi:hypothetical protein